jgi:hypothetical protein
MICIECEHECHCGDSCNALPMDGGCGCVTCIHPTIVPWWRRIFFWTR